MLDYLQKYSLLTKQEAMEIEKRGISLIVHAFEIKELSCKGYTAGQIIAKLLKVNNDYYKRAIYSN